MLRRPTTELLDNFASPLSCLKVASYENRNILYLNLIILHKLSKLNILENNSW